MPLDPERPIEKLLRRHAAKRGEEGGTPPTLHPVTRRLLHSEVRKPYPVQASAAPGRFSIFKPAWGWALGTVAVLLVLSFAILYTGKWPSESPMRLAMGEKD